jgi:hypothetical protein
VLVADRIQVAEEDKRLDEKDYQLVEEDNQLAEVVLVADRSLVVAGGIQVAEEDNRLVRGIQYTVYFFIPEKNSLEENLGKNKFLISKHFLESLIFDSVR